MQTLDFQKPFKYTPPEGFQALTSSIVRPDIAVSRPDKFVKATTYFGTGAVRSVDVGFQTRFDLDQGPR